MKCSDCECERPEPLAEEAHAYHEGSEFAIKAKADFREALEAQAREIEWLRKDAERWRFAESAPSAITLRLHNLRPDQRAQYIDAAKGAPQ